MPRTSPYKTTQRLVQPPPLRAGDSARRRPYADEDYFDTADTLGLTSPTEAAAQGAEDTGADSFYFKVNSSGDNYADFNTGASVSVRISLHYLDSGTETITIGYSTNASSENATKALVTKTNTGRWLWAHKKFDARFVHSVYSSYDNADFRIYSTAAFYADAALLRANSTQNTVKWKADEFDATLNDENSNLAADDPFVGPWVITETYLAYDTDTDATSAGMAPLDYPFYAGATYANRASAPFRATNAGDVTMKTGQIANWNIGTVDAYTISADSGKIKLNSQTPSISLGNSVASDNSGFGTGNGIWMGKYGSNDWRFRVGDPTTTGGVYFGFDNTDLTLRSAGIDVYNGTTQTGNISKSCSAWFGTSSSSKTIRWDTTGAGAGDVRMGGTDDSVFWDDSASTMYVTGNVEISGELHTAVFVKDVIRVEAGTQIIAKNAGILDANFTSAAGSQSIKIKDSAGAAMAAVNDILRIKTRSGDNWFTVTAVGSLVGNSRTYTCTRNSGSNTTYAKGTAVTNYGVSGQGVLLLTADATGAPYYSVQTHAGSPWSSTTERGRFGNMYGAFGTGSNNYYGFGVGDYSGGNYLKYETNGGFELKAGNNNITLDDGGLGFTADGTADDRNEIRWDTAGAHRSGYIISDVGGGDPNYDYLNIRAGNSSGNTSASVNLNAGASSRVLRLTLLDNNTEESIVLWSDTTDFTGVIINTGDNYTWGDSPLGVLELNQGAGDGKIFVLRSSDVAHGVTTLAATSVYAYMQKFSAANGGLDIVGFDDTAGTGVRIAGVVTAANTTHTTGGLGAIIIDGYLKSGTGVTALGTDGNLLTVRNSGTARFHLDGDGDSHQDVGTSWTNFDTHDDLALLNLLSAHVTRRDDPLRETFRGWLEESREPLEKLRLVTFAADGHHFVNWSRMHMLEVGALRQVNRTQQQDRAELERLDARLRRIESMTLGTLQ